jgi:hypothetical protein
VESHISRKTSEMWGTQGLFAVGRTQIRRSHADFEAREAVPFAMGSTCVGGLATVEHHLRARRVGVIL